MPVIKLFYQIIFEQVKCSEKKCNYSVSNDENLCGLRLAQKKKKSIHKILYCVN